MYAIIVLETGLYLKSLSNQELKFTSVASAKAYLIFYASLKKTELPNISTLHYEIVEIDSDPIPTL